MSELKIRCPTTGKLIGTGISMPRESLKTAQLTNNVIRCQACGREHVWSTADVVLEGPDPLKN